MSQATDWAREMEMADLKRPRFDIVDHHGITVDVAEVTDEGALALHPIELSAEQGAALGRWILDVYADTPQEARDG